MLVIFRSYHPVLPFENVVVLAQSKGIEKTVRLGILRRYFLVYLSFDGLRTSRGTRGNRAAPPPLLAPYCFDLVADECDAFWRQADVVAGRTV